MPDIVGDADTDLLAAEYVLGTLDADERSRAQVLLGIDHGFSGMVKVWERRLGELHVMVEPVEPGPKVWERIKGRISDTQPNLEFPVAPAVLATSAAPHEAAPAAKEDDDDDLAVIPPKASAELTTAEEVEAAIAAMVQKPAEIPPRPEANERWPDVARPAPPNARVWQVMTALMTLVAVTLIGLLAAIKFVPDKVPLRVKQVLLPSQFTAPPQRSTQARTPAPPGSSFDE